MAKRELWMREFGAEWRVPAKVRALVATGEAEDQSWRNDVQPHFEALGGRVSLWVNHPNPDERELGGDRFLVTAGEGQAYMDEHRTVFSSDDVDKAIAAFRREVAARSKAKKAVKPKRRAAAARPKAKKAAKPKRRAARR